MFIQQLYTKCLSEAAYYIESNGEAAIIDPLRDIDVYVTLAKERKTTIKYIFETHFHADFVSGHLELQKATGAPIIYGPSAETNFPIINAVDNQYFTLGDVDIQVIHSPGHTLESCCYLLYNEQKQPHALFTGDTLFIGDVGRPDLSSGDLDKEALAGILYDSLQQKIMPLPDDIIIYPAHGAGSSCGKNLSSDTYSTLGTQKLHNYALKSTNKEAFITAVTTGLEVPPPYFPINARMNKEGHEILETILAKGLNPLSVKNFKQKMQEEHTIILDTRAATQFTQGFIPTSINIGLEGRFAEWAGNLLPFDAQLLLVTDSAEKAQETIIRLARVGFNNIIGYLDAGFEAWQKAGEPIDIIIDIDADELAMDLPHDDKIVLLDVRKEIEYGNGHIQGAINIPLHSFTDPVNIAHIDDELNNIYVYCGGGYRSVIAASLLKHQGISHLRNVLGGWDAIQQQKNIDVVQEAAALN